MAIVGLEDGVLCHVVCARLQGNSSVVADLFGWGDDTDYPTLTGNDESVKTPGLFLLGSQVRHQAKKDLWIFCFIYKYVMSLFFPPVALSTDSRISVFRSVASAHLCVVACPAEIVTLSCTSSLTLTPVMIMLLHVRQV